MMNGTWEHDVAELVKTGEFHKHGENGHAEFGHFTHPELEDEVPVDQVTLNLNKLSDDDLLLVRRLINGILEARGHERAKARSSAADEDLAHERRLSSSALKSGGSSRRLGYYEKKYIHGSGPYLYLRFWDHGISTFQIHGEGK